LPGYISSFVSPVLSCLQVEIEAIEIVTVAEMIMNKKYRLEEERNGNYLVLGQVNMHTLFQSWALALFFRLALHSPLNFYPWIAIALSLILPIFRFAHRSIALKKTSGSLLEKSAKMLDRC